MAGYNPLNIGGMFDWYDHPERIVGGNTRPAAQNGNGNRPTSKVGRSMQACDTFEAMFAIGDVT
jgi:hypothetical protein